MSNDYSINYWEDNAILYAEHLISEFTQDDWALLEKNWKERTTQWRQYCAQIISWCASANAIPILIQMLNSQEDDLVVIAADSLRIYDPSLVKSKIKSSSIEYLNQLRNRSSVVSSLIISDFLKSLSI